MKRKPLLLLVSLLLVSFLAAGWWMHQARQQAAANLCVSIQELSRHSLVLGSWVSEAAADPFLGQAALLGPPNGLLAEARARARVSITRGRPGMFPPALVDALRQLAGAPAHGAALSEALRSVAATGAGFRCDERNPASPEQLAQASAFAEQVGAAGKFWEDRKASSLLDRQEFERDRVIFCRSESLLHGLQRVAQAAGLACRSAKAGSRLAQSCEAGSDRKGEVNAEMEELEKQKEFNLRKLRQKWPEGVLEGLRC